MDTAIRLARGLAELLPGEPEVGGLLALLLLTDARRPARTSDGDLVLLEDQDRGRGTGEGRRGGRLLARACAWRPGRTSFRRDRRLPLHRPTREDTDWRQIAALYGELIRYEPTPVVEANRAIAVAMARGRRPGW